MRRLIIAAAAVVALGAAAACAPANSTSGNAQSTTVDITVSDFAFQPPEATVTAGPATFKVRNKDKVEHEFELFSGNSTSGTPVDEVEGIAPGISRELKVTVKTGQYTYVCKLPGHEERGQRGTLTVV